LKTLLGLVPLAIGVAAIGLVISWLLSRQMSIGVWLLGGFLLAHGLIHVMFVAPAPASAGTDGATPWPFDMARSWLVSGAHLDPGAVRALGTALVCAVVGAFILASLATVDIVVPAAWWPALVAVSAAASAVLLGLFFGPQLILGVAIDAVLVWVVVTSAWAPAAI
jgi:hypothetical protein